MLHIAALEPDKYAPRNEEFRFRARAKGLVDGCHQILNAKKPAGGRGGDTSPTSGIGHANGKANNKEKDDGQDAVTECTKGLNLNGMLFLLHWRPCIFCQNPNLRHTLQVPEKRILLLHMLPLPPPQRKRTTKGLNKTWLRSWMWMWMFLPSLLPFASFLEHALYTSSPVLAVVVAITSAALPTCSFTLHSCFVPYIIQCFLMNCVRRCHKIVTCCQSVVTIDI